MLIDETTPSSQDAQDSQAPAAEPHAEPSQGDTKPQIRSEPQYNYRSQWDADASGRVNDCGPACVAMVLDRFGEHVTIDAISNVVMPGQDVGSATWDLVHALRSATSKVNASQWIGTANAFPALPAICLVKYSGFARSSVWDVGFFGWHWLLLLKLNEAGVVCHDPNYTGSRRNEGAYKRYSRQEFDAAFQVYDTTRVAITWHEEPDALAPISVQVHADGYARVRSGPSTSDAILGTLPTGTHLQTCGNRDGWAIVELSAGGAPMCAEGDAGAPVTGYVFGELLHEV
jgi:hypothetical protein